MSSVKSNGIHAPISIEDAPAAPPSSKALIDDAPVGDVEASKRYEITVERQIIIYAPDGEIAQQRALAYFGFRPKPGEVIPCRVAGVRELPLLDKRGPIVEGPSGRPSSK